MTQKHSIDIEIMPKLSHEHCTEIWNAILHNTSNKRVTGRFFKNLSEINHNQIYDILNHAQTYFHITKLFLESNEEGKLLFFSNRVLNIKKEKYTCCKDILDSSNPSLVLDHIISLEHYLVSNKVHFLLHSNIELVVEYLKIEEQRQTIKSVLIIYYLSKHNKHMKNILKRY